MYKVRIGIVGIGNIGTAHANTLFGGKVEGAVLAAVCDISSNRRKFCKETYEGVEIFDNEIIACPKKSKKNKPSHAHAHSIHQ